MPGLSRDLPDGLAMLAGDGFVVTGVCVVGLNMLFRLGTRLRASCQLDPHLEPVSHQVLESVERQGGAWGARMDIVRRAAMAALEASEVIQAAGGGRLLVIRGSFDEFNFDPESLHEGEPLQVGHAAGDASADAGGALAVPFDLDALMNSDIADVDIESRLDAAMVRVSGVLLRHLADKLSSAKLGTGHAGWRRR